MTIAPKLSSKERFISIMNRIINEKMHYKSKDFILVLDTEMVNFLSLRRYEEFAYSKNNAMKTKHYVFVNKKNREWKQFTSLVCPDSIKKIGYTPKHNERAREFVDRD